MSFDQSSAGAVGQADAFPGEPAQVGKPAPVDWLDVLPPQAECLRSYQRKQLAEVSAAMHAGIRRILVQLATGGGKTHEIAAMVAAASIAGLRVLILATRTRLVRQIHERLTGFGLWHGVIAASLPELRNYNRTVQVASVDTLHRRAIVNERIPMPGAELVIFDEAHLATADTRLGILDAYPNAIRVGFTATPARKSGRSLNAAFDTLIVGPSIRELTPKHLVPTRIFNTPVVTQKELSGLPKDTDNDFANGALGMLLSRPKLVGDIVENWLRIAERKRTICFAVNKSHAQALLDSFARNGIPAEMLTDQDEEATREEVIGRLESGQTRVVINCFLLSYGADLPAVECIVLARPTRSLTMYLQMVGRGLRPSPGKTDCIIIDHGHVVETLGLPQSDFGWTLDSGRNVNAEAISRSKKSSSTEKLRTCKQCSGIWMTSEQGNACPSCGWLPAQKARDVVVQQAQLEEMAEPETYCAHDAVVERFYREAIGWDMRRSPDKWVGNDPQTGKSLGNKRRYVNWMRTCRRFKLSDNSPPRHIWNLSAIPCSEGNAGWLQSDQIRFNRSRARLS